MTEQRFTVEHLANESRFALFDHGANGDEAQEIGKIEYLDVAGEDRERIMYHTRVSDDYSGQGLASVLARAAVEQTIDGGSKIVAVCPYIAAWFKKNADAYGEHQVSTTPEHLEAVQNR